MSQRSTALARLLSQPLTVSLSVACWRIGAHSWSIRSGKDDVAFTHRRITTANKWELFELPGSDLRQLSSTALADFRLRQIGFVFQFFQLFSALTAVRMSRCHFGLLDMSQREARQQAEVLLERFGLSQRLSHRPQDLSGGEKQRVALARALALRPPVIIADEPTGSLDSRNGEEVIRLLRQLVDDEQRTVLVASHDQRITQVATRILHCEDGHLGELSSPAKEFLLS